MLTAKQAGVMLGISARLVYDLAARGDLPSHRFSSSIRFDSVDVETYKAACRVKVTPPPRAELRKPPTVRLEKSLGDGGLAAYFRKAGIKPRPMPSSAKGAAKK